MKYASLIFLFFTLTGSVFAQENEPPFRGTIFLDGDIISYDDPTTFQGLVYKGQETRNMYDRRLEGTEYRGRKELEAWLFEATFHDTIKVEVQVNPEFDRDTAEYIANYYAEAIGRIPVLLFKNIKRITIHAGNNPFGGGRDGVLIHTGMAARYERTNILEETLVHEASHTSLDRPHAREEKWIEAQEADGMYISTYARDNRYREDIAETYLLYLAHKCRPERISAGLNDTIVSTVPNRIKYFDSLGFDPFPIE